MRIIETIASLGSGGAETLVKDLSIGLKGKGAEVLVIVVDPFYNDPSEKNKIKLLNKNGILVKSLNRKPGKKQFSTYFILSKIIREFKPDIIHFHSFIAGTYLMPFILFSGDIKFFQTIHNTKYSLGSLSSFIQKNIFSRYNSLIYCSNEAAFSFKVLYGKGDVINNGVKIDKPNNIRNYLNSHFNIPIDAIILLNVGRTVHQKNQSLLLDLVESLNKKSFNGKLYLLICGSKDSDEIYEELKKKIQTMKFKKQIHLLGVRNDIVNLMYSSDFYISSSIHEGLPITGLEAMNVGIPMILSPIPEHLNVFKNEYEVYFPNSSDLGSYVDLFSNIEVNKDKNDVIIQRNNFNNRFSMEENINKHYSLFKKSFN